jgi:hypothetical protein
LIEIFKPAEGSLQGWNGPQPNGYDRSHGL